MRPDQNHKAVGQTANEAELFKGHQTHCHVVFTSHGSLMVFARLLILRENGLFHVLLLCLTGSAQTVFTVWITANCKSSAPVYFGIQQIFINPFSEQVENQIY